MDYIIATSDGEILCNDDYRYKLKVVKKYFQNLPLIPSRIIMSKQEYEDILAWGEK